MCHMVHYIDNDWILKKNILNFKLLLYLHICLVILDAIEGCTFY
ncbi:hypothetical protein AMTRI_Chr12g236230 [Amborella trichopoda]